jgi:hypothetical protein
MPGVGSDEDGVSASSAVARAIASLTAAGRDVPSDPALA